MSRLENWYYLTSVGGFHDTNNITGNLFGDQKFWTIPQIVAFDKKKMAVRTYSGSVYLLGRCSGNLEQEINFIEEDVNVSSIRNRS
jgi:hypothetical protein